MIYLHLDGAILDCSGQAAGGRQAADVGRDGAIKVCSTMPIASGVWLMIMDQPPAMCICQASEPQAVPAQRGAGAQRLTVGGVGDVLEGGRAQQHVDLQAATRQSASACVRSQVPSCSCTSRQCCIVGAGDGSRQRGTVGRSRQPLDPYDPCSTSHERTSYSARPQTRTSLPKRPTSAVYRPCATTCNTPQRRLSH